MIKSKRHQKNSLFKKYILSILNFRKKELDVFSTVLSMREQRMKMVQKPQQYLYIFKCLRDEIRMWSVECDVDGEYYNL